MWCVCMCVLGRAVLCCSTLPDDPSVSLAALGVAHGELLFMAYDMEREVEPAYKPGPLDSKRPFGSHVTVSCFAWGWHTGRPGWVSSTCLCCTLVWQQGVSCQKGFAGNINTCGRVMQWRMQRLHACLDSNAVPLVSACLPAGC